jgi:hypothetical protein
VRFQRDLRRCVERPEWTSIRGSFTSRGKPPFRFVFRRPGDWRFESTIDDDVLGAEGAEQLMGAKADHAWLARPQP